MTLTTVNAGTAFIQVIHSRVSDVFYFTMSYLATFLFLHHLSCPSIICLSINSSDLKCAPTT